MLGSLAAVDEIYDDFQFARTPEQKSELIGLRQSRIREVVVEFPDKRSSISPFLELIDQYEKELRFGKS